MGSEENNNHDNAVHNTSPRLSVMHISHKNEGTNTQEN